MWDVFNISIERAFDVNPNIIIMGDLNENLLNINNINLRNILLLNNLENIIVEPTRITPTSSTLIDPVIVYNNIVSGCLDIENRISDHKATFIYLESNLKNNACISRKVWFYYRANFLRLNDLISTKCWDFINTLTVDQACDQLTEKLLEFMNECIFSKVVTVRPNDKPWYDSEIRRFTKYRDRQISIARKRNSQVQWSKYKII